MATEVAATRTKPADAGCKTLVMEEVIKEYELTIEQLQAALAYAAK